jgi:tetratricopeptide (TPR) repeat protein
LAIVLLEIHLICDLVGSTALSAPLDPEDMRAVIGAYHRCAAETAEGFSGFVARFMGDGVLVYFGYPQAHEDVARPTTSTAHSTRSSTISSAPCASPRRHSRAEARQARSTDRRPIRQAALRDAGDRWEYAGRAGSLAIPPTLRDSLMARLDRFAPVKEIAQIGAAIGREFAHELIRPVAQRPEPDLETALDKLADAGLLFCRGAPPHCWYVFKHALVQDVAYATLLRARRRQLHEAIGATLEREFPETAATQPELHCTEAGLTEQAVQYWRRAGERALARSANPEAIAHLTRGIQLLDGLPQSRQRDEQELQFQAALIGLLWASRGFGSPDAERASRRALELCERAAPDTSAHFRAHFRALWGLMYAYLIPGDLRGARPLAEQLLALAERRQDPEHLAYAHAEMGMELLWSAELIAARRHLEQGIALYDPEWGRPGSSLQGVNCDSNCHTFLTRVCWHLGYPEQALQHSGQAIAIAEDISPPFGQAIALIWTAALHQLRGEARRTQELAETSLTLAIEQGFPFLAGVAMVFRGWAMVEQGESEKGIAQLRQGLVAYRATGAEMESSQWLGMLAEACLDAGRTEEGLRTIAEALDLSRGPASSITSRSCGGSKANCGYARIWQTPSALKAAFSALSRLPASSRRNPGNCAPR